MIRAKEIARPILFVLGLVAWALWVMAGSIVLMLIAVARLGGGM